MIFKVINLQTLFNAIFIVSAGIWYTSSYIFEIKYGGPVTMVWFCFASCHPVLDSMLILYYIKPYRSFIKKKFETILLLFGWKPREIVPVTHPTNIQRQLPKFNNHKNN